MNNKLKKISNNINYFADLIKNQKRPLISLAQKEESEEPSFEEFNESALFAYELISLVSKLSSAPKDEKIKIFKEIFSKINKLSPKNKKQMGGMVISKIEKKPELKVILAEQSKKDPELKSQIEEIYSSLGKNSNFLNSQNYEDSSEENQEPSYDPVDEEEFRRFLVALKRLESFCRRYDEYFNQNILSKYLREINTLNKNKEILLQGWAENKEKIVLGAIKLAANVIKTRDKQEFVDYLKDNGETQAVKELKNIWIQILKAAPRQYRNMSINQIVSLTMI
jgi:hypothetical protein